MTMQIKAVFVIPMFGALLLTGCASNTPTSAPTVTVTASPRVVVFNPSTSGRTLAARLAVRAKPKNPKDKITDVECKNFADISVGTHTDCQLRVNGIKRGFRATFTRRVGHYSVVSQALTW